MPQPSCAGGEHGRWALVLGRSLPYPLNEGYCVRTFHIVREIATRFSTTLIVFHPPRNDGRVQAFREALGCDIEIVTAPSPKKHTPGRLLLGLVTPLPVHYWNARSRAFAGLVRKAVRRHHYVLGVSMTNFLFPYLEYLEPPARAISDTHNLESVVLRRYLGHLPRGPHRTYVKITARKLERLEDTIFTAADSIWVCSEKERELVTARVPRTRVDVVPNGVDTGSVVGCESKAPRRGCLLFFGQLDYFPNANGLRLFLERILPLVVREHPAVQLRVVGRGGDLELRDLCRNNPNVLFAGPVEDIRSELEAAEVVVVPLQVGGGTRLKILEALGAGRPVVSTTIGAEGLTLKDGEDILIADTPEEFCSAVLKLLRDPLLRERIAQAGQRTVRRLYDWSVIGRQVGRLLVL